MMGIQIAKAAFNTQPIVVDVDDAKLDLALQNGASHTINSTKEGAFEEIHAMTGGVGAVIDFVGSDLSTGFAANLLRKGGKYIIVGLYGVAYPVADSNGLAPLGLLEGGKVTKSIKQGDPISLDSIELPDNLINELRRKQKN